MGEWVRVEDPRRVRWVVEALCSGPKLQILKMLLTNSPLTASEISRRLGVKLSTTLTHLEGLLAAGLIKAEESGMGRVVRRYSLVAPGLEIRLDLRTLLEPAPCVEGGEGVEAEVEALAVEYLRVRRRGRSKLQIRPRVRDVMSALGVDLDTAIEVTRYINTHQRDLAKLLRDDLIEVVRASGGSASVGDLARRLKVHPYWVVLCAENLSREGVAEIADGVIRLKTRGDQAS